MLCTTCRTLCFALVTLVPAYATAEFIWIEGEAAEQHGMQQHNWYDDVDKDSLSAGRWLSHFAEGDSPVAEYRLAVTGDATFDFWIRCNPAAGAQMAFQLDAGSWQAIDLSTPQELTNIANDGKPDMRFIAWIRVGQLAISAGGHRLRIRFDSRNQHHGAVDCLVLTSETFRPRGPLKPGQRSHKANPGFFAWEPDIDPFSTNALVDLRPLNEAVAGMGGRVRAEGDHFVLGNDQKVKFWATNAGPGIWALDHESHTYLAKRLAKTGVNMVRLHGPLYSSDDPAIDRRRLDQLHHLVHALKNEGIYVSLSFYFPLWFHLDDDQPSFMLLFFDEEMQQIYRRWARELLTTRNPYTKLTLAEDPAVAIVEIVNEDSHFFWTFSQQNMPPRRWRRLTQLFGDWLRKKYGTLEQAVVAWGEIRETADDLPQGRVALYDAWSMTSGGIQANPEKRARISDQVQFLAENMRDFYQQTRTFLRQACAYTGLVSCGNWHTADAAQLDPLERYCYTAGDVIDHHGYFDHGHSGEAASYSVRPGQEFTSQSALHLQAANPLPFVETEGFPHIISEVNWPAPNMYRAEFTFLASSYGCLQGLDGVYSFALGSAGWDQQLNKFPVSTPVVLGCFPAAALVYRRDDVQQGSIVVQDNLRLEELYKLRPSGVYANGAIDQLRAASIPAGARQEGIVATIDPLCFYVGRVVRSFAGNPNESFQLSMQGLIDRKRRRVQSVTHELIWDYGLGVTTLNTPRSQGAAGFLGRAGNIELGDVSLEMRNEYGTVTVVSLDNRPLPESNTILVQAMTVEQPYQFQASGENNRSGRIERVGSAPLGVERLQVTLRLKMSGHRPPSVQACDEHGYPRPVAVAVAGEADDFRIVLDPTSPYHVIQR